jgi:hypothetical protein
MEGLMTNRTPKAPGLITLLLACGCTGQITGTGGSIDPSNASDEPTAHPSGGASGCVSDPDRGSCAPAITHGDLIGAAGPCPIGQTPVYHYTAANPNYGTGGRIDPIPAGPHPNMSLTCESISCPGGQVGIDMPDNAFAPRGTPQTGPAGAASSILCADAPPSCPTGQDPAFVPPDYSLPGSASTGAGGWHCAAPCEVVLRFGGLYGLRSVCAPAPPANCPDGQEATFVVGEEVWQCTTPCDGGQYDPVDYAGRQLCVPC